MQSNLYPAKMRILEALDRGEAISFDDLRRRAQDGRLKELIDQAGAFPNPAMPDTEWGEVETAVTQILLGNAGDEAEHFYVSNNGYCLLMAVLFEAERTGRLRRNTPPA